MLPVLLLSGAALLLRSLAALLRHGDALPVRWAGWPACGAAAWCAGSAAGAWTPIWIPVAAAALIGFAEVRRGHAWLSVGVDAVAVILTGMLSIPALPSATLIGAGALFAAAGLAADRLARLPGIRLRRALTATGELGCAGLLAGLVVALPSSSRDPFLSPLHAGAAPLYAGLRVDLKTGAVAWLDRAPDESPHPGALVFHGNHRLGARQKAAQVIRRALVAAGFRVLAVDHPGYGASPCPPAEAPVHVWDPLPTETAALEYLKSLPGVGRIHVVGHSMGCSSALRLAGEASGIGRVILLGAGLMDPPERDRYWFGRFHRERQLTGELAWDRFLEIRNRFYDNARLAAALDESHAPIEYVQLQYEYPNLVRSRDVLYELIPGPKRRLQVASTHYFDTLQLAGIMVGDTRATARLTELFRDSARPGGTPE